MESRLGNLRKRKEKVCAIVFVKESLMTSEESGLRSGRVPILCECQRVEVDTTAK